jgi:hypothetical protein
MVRPMNGQTVPGNIPEVDVSKKQIMQHPTAPIMERFAVPALWFAAGFAFAWAIKKRN